ncbi:MAG TPA: TIGR04454 family lipoprotein [Leptospiraceae bacterium]|nr:TIGR04454 family lipoprotein [Leptospiraceae bacterium]HNN03978.1 TIGR04454 family lipoprotein [Leptospiraceae bacterium]HNO25007.1 TIGR04454 family lipoprotein [Leptospiraceae bacterium]
MRVLISGLLFFVFPLSADYTEIKSAAQFLFQIHPSAECNAIANILIENFKSFSPENSKEIESRRFILISGIQKECENRRYDLDCLRHAKNPAEMNVCKK